MCCKYPIINYLNHLLISNHNQYNSPRLFGFNDGEVDFQVTGGTPEFILTLTGWRSITSSPITNLFPGTVDLVSVDNNNCLDSNEVNLTNQF